MPVDVFVQWLRATPASQWINTSTWIWPLCESLHFMGLSLLVGITGFFDLRLMGFFKRVSIAAAIGKISAESICPYPPGIPVLIPGEVITAAAINYLQQILDLGGELAGCSDPTLETMRIVDPIRLG